MNRDVVNILGVNIDRIDMGEAVENAVKLVSEDGVSVIYTPNPEIIMEAYNDPAFAEVLNSADMCVSDGIGVVYGAKILKTPLKGRVPGFDLSLNLIKRMGRMNKSVFLFGSKPGVAEQAGRKLTDECPGLKIAGCRNGYFKPEDEAEIIDEINRSGADLLMVCLGAPKQEKWIHENKNRLDVKLCIGAGGSLDVLAGTVKRAPDLFIKLNLEWFCRLCKQPSRIGRFMALPKFAMIVLKESVRKTNGK